VRDAALTGLESNETEQSRTELLNEYEFVKNQHKERPDLFVDMRHRVMSNGKVIGVVMELADGGNLDEYCATIYAHHGPLDLRAVADLCKPVLAVLAVMHSRKEPLIHRDVKPGNILVFYKKPAPGATVVTPVVSHVKLADFGSAKKIAGSMTLGRGTLLYMAPEMTETECTIYRYNASADVYSFGLTLATLLSRYAVNPPVVVAQADRDDPKIYRQVVLEGVLDWVDERAAGLAQLLEACCDVRPVFRPPANVALQVLEGDSGSFVRWQDELEGMVTRALASVNTATIPRRLEIESHWLHVEMQIGKGSFVKVVKAKQTSQSRSVVVAVRVRLCDGLLCRSDSTTIVMWYACRCLMTLPTCSRTQSLRSRKMAVPPSSHSRLMLWLLKSSCG
jgi:hypothetical protein